MAKTQGKTGNAAATPAAPDAPAAGDQADGAALAGVRVRAVGTARRYRIGRCFGNEPTEIAAADIDEADLTALLNDPFLVVEFVGEAS